jgi:molybdenum cofactor biosynthesis enzyme MoaA
MLWDFLLLEQTNACNLSCPGCPNRLHQRPRGVMSPEVFRSAIGQIVQFDAALYCWRTVLHGTGEPLLSPHLWQNLACLDEFSFWQVDLLTNGLLLNDDNIARLMSFSCLKSLRVGLNSARPHVAQQILGSAIAFGPIVANIRRLLAANPRFQVFVQSLITQANAEETEEEMYRAIGRRDFTVIRKHYNDIAGQVSKSPLMFGEDRRACIFGHAALAIQWDGDITGCCGDDTKSQVVGNVKDGIMSEKVQTAIAERRKELAARDFSRLPLCAKCLGVT